MLEDDRRNDLRRLFEAPHLQVISQDADPRTVRSAARETKRYLKRVNATKTGPRHYSGSVGSVEVDIKLSADQLFVVEALATEPADGRPRPVAHATFALSPSAKKGQPTEQDVNSYMTWISNEGGKVLRDAFKVGKRGDIQNARARAAGQKSKATRDFPRGTVVTFKGRRRRYVVTDHSPKGNLNLVALSGGFRGSAPSGVEPSEVKKDADQTVEFSGKDAARLKRRYSVASVFARS